MGEGLTLGPKIARLLAIHPDTAKLSQKGQSTLLGVVSSTISRWRSGREPKLEHLTRAAKIFGISSDDFQRPIDELEKMVGSSGHLDWAHSDWGLTSRFVSRWRPYWADTYEILKGTHLLCIRIPRPEREDVISCSLLLVSELLYSKGIRFSVVNIDDHGGKEHQVSYIYDGLAFPVADTIFFVGERVDGAEPLAMILDRPSMRAPTGGFLTAVGVAPGRHYPMSRRAVVIPQSTQILTIEEM